MSLFIILLLLVSSNFYKDTATSLSSTPGLDVPTPTERQSNAVGSPLAAASFFTPTVERATISVPTRASAIIPKTITSDVPSNTALVATTAVSPTLASMTILKRLQGHGTQISAKFALDAGLVVFHLVSDGDGYFSMSLVEPAGKDDDFLANGVSSFDGTVARGITTPGEYAMDISSSGNWIIEIGKPDTEVSGPLPPITFKGHGWLVTPLFYLDTGLYTFTFHHAGKSSFVVWLLDADGERVEDVADLGNYSHYVGAQTFRIDNNGAYVLTIEAAGDWTVDIIGGAPPPAIEFTRLAAGQGSQTSPKFTLKAGLITFRVHNAGKSNFDIWLLDKDGTRLAGLAADIGSYDGVITLRLREGGLYSVSVESDGAWTVDQIPLN